jgi:hypothetical protein
MRKIGGHSSILFLSFDKWELTDNGSKLKIETVWGFGFKIME